MTAYRLDHLVLTVRDVDRTCSFYQDLLGIPAITFGAGRRALQLGSQKINLHPAAAPLQPHAQVPTPGAADLCLLTDTPVEQLQAWLSQQGVCVVLGPVRRTGATGPLSSIYIRDPDGNLIELSNSVREQPASVAPNRV